MPSHIEIAAWKIGSVRYAIHEFQTPNPDYNWTQTHYQVLRNERWIDAATSPGEPVQFSALILATNAVLETVAKGQQAEDADLTISIEKTLRGTIEFLETYPFPLRDQVQVDAELEQLNFAVGLLKGVRG